MKKLILFILLIAAMGCSPSKRSARSVADVDYSNAIHVVIGSKTTMVAIVSADPTYGYTEKNPVKVGPFADGPKNEREFLSRLSGPDGQEVKFTRLGSCCPFKTKNSLLGGKGMLDMYQLTYDGLEEPVVLYLNMYDPGERQMVPHGFKFKEK